MSRAINLTNMAHQFDLQARKLISLTMAEMKNHNLSILKALGKELSTLKQQHISAIHKPLSPSLPPPTLDALVERFSQEVQECIHKINEPP